MDRRNALKKIAVGGATVVGASTVISRPAFAYEPPTLGANTSFRVFTNASYVLNLEIIQGSAACPMSATSQSATAISITWGVTSDSGDLFVNDDPLTSAGATGFGVLMITPAFADSFADGEEIILSGTVVWQCQYSDQTTRTTDAVVTRTPVYTDAGGGWA